MTERNSTRTAYQRLVELLARRDHSRHELREKLKTAGHSQEEIETVIALATEKRWLPDESILASREANRLARAGKSRPQIFSWLKKKGLPTVGLQFEDDSGEAESAYKVADKAWRRLLRAAEKDQARNQLKNSNKEASLRARVNRLLASRGFSGSIARSVYERLVRENPLE